MKSVESMIAEFRARSRIRELARTDGSRWSADRSVGADAHASMNRDLRAAFQRQCERSIGRFRQRVSSEWTERSILLSEGLAICAMCDLFDIDLLIESGTYNGRSTDVFARYLDPARRIHTIDIEIRQEARDRLQPWENVVLHEGDSRTRMLELIAEGGSDRVAVFIDGPKGRAAVRLAIDVLNQPAVCFAAIHDVNRTRADGVRPARARELFDAVSPLRLATDEDWFVDASGELDVGEGGRDLVQRLQWEPYGYRDTESGAISRHLGSYGPTVGFAVLAPLPPMRPLDAGTASE